jgi:RNA polymerase sigma-70 factor (ECF subfamily)
VNSNALTSAAADLPRTLRDALAMMMAADDAPPMPWSDEVAAARGGDQSAFEALVRGLQRPIYGLCLRLLSNDAEASEVAQETFLRAWHHLDRYDPRRPFELWVMAIARNLCLDILRRRSRARVEDVEPLREVLASSAPNQEDIAVARQERQSLEEAMATLSVQDREVLALYYVQRRTTREIAEVMDVAPGTIMARLFRAREKLRRQMQEQEVQA